MLNLTQLESSLWEAADQLRANSTLNASEYSMPVLGLIFLRYATNRYEVVRSQVEQTLPSRGGKKRALTPADFKSKAALFLPETAHYDYLLGLPDSENLGQKLVQAVKDIEAQSELLKGVLPKEYASFDKALLQNLVRIFGRDELKTATGDVFGRIYEYFLNKFAMSGAQEGGEFFTPPSLVRMIVNVIEPTQGVVFDPACGSAGMFVQTGHFLDRLDTNVAQKVTFYGQELLETNTRLAKMNLAVHGLDGNIRQSNTFDDPRQELIGACDYVMANPPFNVDMVDLKRIYNDERLFTTKKIPGTSKRSGKVSNANYLWVQYFYSYLKKGVGRAGFVMPSSASDSGHGEKAIREEIIATGDVDVIISIGTNFFYVQSLPCMLWFFDKGKPTRLKDKVLMIDARNIYRIVSRRIRDFSEEQLELITATVWLYRGDSSRYNQLIWRYFNQVYKKAQAVLHSASELKHTSQAFLCLSDKAKAFSRLKDSEKSKEPVENTVSSLSALREVRGKLCSVISEIVLEHDSQLYELKSSEENLFSNERQRRYSKQVQLLIDGLVPYQMLISEALNILCKISTDKKTARSILDKDEYGDYLKLTKSIKGSLTSVERVIETLLDSYQQIKTLQDYFPESQFSDVLGFCRIVDRADIALQDSSLTPGRYVGASPSKVVDSPHVNKLKENVSGWNQWRERTRNIRPDLTKADLQNLYLNKADLSNAILQGANFGNSNLSGSILQNADMRGASLHKTNLKKSDLREASLLFSDLKGADLEQANLYSTDLRDASFVETNLKRANLSEARVLRTNFQNAVLTGACISDWQINSETNLDGVECSHVYRAFSEEKGFTKRLPIDSTSSFEKNEFADRFRVLEKASDTIDLTFSDGIDWSAFFLSFQEICMENSGKDISVQSMEKKGETFVIKVEVDSDIDQELVERTIKLRYDEKLKFLEGEYRDQKVQNVSLVEIIRNMSQQNSGPKFDLRHAQIAGGISETSYGNQSGTINNYGASLEEIENLLTSLKGNAQAFPLEQREEAVDILEDLESNIKKPEPNREKVKRYLKKLLMLASTVSALTNGAATVTGDLNSFTDGLIELAAKVDIPCEQVEALKLTSRDPQ